MAGAGRTCRHARAQSRRSSDLASIIMVSWAWDGGGTEIRAPACQCFPRRYWDRNGIGSVLELDRYQSGIMGLSGGEGQYAVVPAFSPQRTDETSGLRPQSCLLEGVLPGLVYYSVAYLASGDPNDVQQSMRSQIKSNQIRREVDPKIRPYPPVRHRSEKERQRVNKIKTCRIQLP